MVLFLRLFVLVNSAFFKSISCNVVALENDMPTTRWFLDNMESLHGQERETYPDDQFSRIQTCLGRFSSDDLNLKVIAEKIFSGILAYGISGGALDGSDPWIYEQVWLEYDPSPLTSDKTSYPGAEEVVIYEPCNYASNVAYYRAAVELCERNESNDIGEEYITGLVQTLSTLMPGSALFHGSSTRLGAMLDVTPIIILSLIQLQKSISKYPFDPVTHNIQRPDEPTRNLTGLAAAEEMVMILNNTNVYGWSEALRPLRSMDYTRGWIAIVVVVLEVMFQGDPESAESILQFLIPMTETELDEDDTEFFLSIYQPSIREMLSDVTISGSEKALISNRFAGALVKMFYAFYWQEGGNVGSHLTSEEENIEGAESIPRLVSLANSMSGYRYADNDLQSAIDVYPGDKACRKSQPHSKWHEMSGLGLIDFSLLSFDLDTILRNPTNDGTTVKYGLLHCLVFNDCLQGLPNDIIGITNCLLFTCQDKTNERLLLCLLSCGEDMSCFLDCLIEYGEIGFTVSPLDVDEESSDSLDFNSIKKFDEESYDSLNFTSASLDCDSFCWPSLWICIMMLVWM